MVEPEERREKGGVMCAYGARPGSIGPHVGGSPTEGGHSTLSAPSGLIGSLPTRRYMYIDYQIQRTEHQVPL